MGDVAGVESAMLLRFLSVAAGAGEGPLPTIRIGGERSSSEAPLFTAAQAFHTTGDMGLYNLTHGRKPNGVDDVLGIPLGDEDTSFIRVNWQWTCIRPYVHCPQAVAGDVLGKGLGQHPGWK